MYYGSLLSPARVVRWLDHLDASAVERDMRCMPLVRGLIIIIIIIRFVKRQNVKRLPWRLIRAAARVRRVRLRKSNYVKIIPTHMIIREIIPGRQQMVRRCPLYVTVAGTLISSIKVSVALTSVAEVIDLAGSID